ncbi:uncharacterized protein LOC111375129 [Olea europaea var. sylvestris]|uniref:uncharacterized protein LOC111375129 n=1 Tax=Olea europaea var. sylvestris TaxID=158386 RepID=UPI000C1CE68F|nr:uncharacterized protein LOC111375129 [Olea europaea var. sylvestris]XP_022853695.1 uncharacterized protein LOC111375129 [Olea europaea var. sylvestris]
MSSSLSKCLNSERFTFQEQNLTLVFDTFYSLYPHPLSHTAILQLEQYFLASKMVKVERVTLPTPDLPVPPPGFSLKTPAAKSATTSATAGLSQPLSQPPLEETSREQPPAGTSTRRTSRRRVRPQFYSPALPPQQYRRRRSRTSKARSISQLSFQEKVTGKCNQPSMTFSRWQEQMTHVSQSRSQINNGTTTNPLPIRETEQAPNIIGKSNGIIVDENRASDTNSNGITVDKNRASDTNSKTNLALTMNSITEKHGDITKDCLLESDRMKTLVLFGICEVVQDLQKKQLKDIDISMLESCYSAVQDAEKMKMNVKWLRNRLDEIKDAMVSAGEALRLMDEKKRLMKSIDNKKKDILLHKGELKRLNSEIEEMESQVARDTVILEALDKNIRTQTSKVQLLEQMPLMDWLI